MKCNFCEKETNSLVCEHCGCDNEVIETQEKQTQENFSSIISEYQQTEQKKNPYEIATVVCYILSALYVIMGFFKILVYDGDVNAYVGGDAYNLIINGTYGVAYFVLAMMFVIMAIGFTIINILKDNK